MGAVCWPFIVSVNVPRGLLPLNGTLSINGVAVGAGSSVSASDIAAGRLLFTPAANAKGTPYASFTFQVQDDGGTASGGADTDPTPNTIVVNVTSANDAPLTADRTIGVNLSGTTSSIYRFSAGDFNFSDPLDVPADALLAVTIVSLPTSGALNLNGTPVQAGATI